LAEQGIDGLTVKLLIFFATGRICMTGKDNAHCADLRAFPIALAAGRGMGMSRPSNGASCRH
jgi:hypothetical protein